MTTGSPTDADLLDRFNQTGDEDAFRMLVERYLGFVFGVALRRTGSYCNAEEAAQAVFTILARKAGRLRTSASLSAWLYRCTLIETAELLRRRRAHEQKMQAFGERIKSMEGRDIWSEVLPLLDESIQTLRTADRRMILLRFFEQKSFRQMGAALTKTF